MSEGEKSNSGFICCFCGESIKKSRWEPLSLPFHEPIGSWQCIFSHVNCLGGKLHESVSFRSLEQRITSYNEWLQKQIEDLKIGQLVSGWVTKIKDYGVWVNLGDFHALLHISEISQLPVEHPSQVFKEGDRIQAIIIHLDAPKRRISLSTRELEYESGDMLKDPEAVYANAEKMAARYNELVLSRLTTNPID